MKRTLLLTGFILLLISSCAAQKLQKSASAPKAIKITEVLYFCNTELDISIARFAKILKKNPNANGYIVVYANPKIADFASFLTQNSVRMLEDAKIALGRIVFLQGGFREDTTAEFFLVPNGALTPVPTPTLDREGNALKP